jgi:DNA-binding Xre family transcriptional regulator
VSTNETRKAKIRCIKNKKWCLEAVGKRPKTENLTRKPKLILNRSKPSQRRDAICAEIARLMGEERKRLKFSKNKLASLTGLNQSTVSRLENYHENLTMDSLLRVADVLKVNLGDVIKQAIRNVEKGRG